MNGNRHGANAARRGFTIVELLMVVGIIAVLMGIITTAASSSIKSSRTQKAEALCALVQAGLATYREQIGKWPVDLPTERTNTEGAGGRTDPDKIVLTGTEVRTCVKKLVDEAKKGNPMMDISGLFVSRSEGELVGDASSGAKGQNASRKVKPAFGLDFMPAVRGTKQSKKKMKTSEMYFGYPDPDTGYFLRFKMVYSIPADVITVSKQR